MKFINRENELTTLEEEYKKDSSFVVIYGRRRTGKTTLIKEFIKNKDAVYLFADTQNEIIQIERFKNIIAEHIKDNILKNLDIKTWDNLFSYILKNLNFSKKIILIIDEFQYLYKVNNNFPSIFQRIWDQGLKNKKIMLILCGSLISMMYKSVLNYNSPLYGRRTSQIRLKPMNFYDYIKFFSDKNIIKTIEFYSVTGGIPKYIEFFNLNKTIMFNIEEKILDKNNFLYEEPKFILREEVTETNSYFSILQVIAEGNHKIGNIASRLNIQTQNLTSFIGKLLELDILERIIPITEDNPQKSKKGLYFIKDNFFKFWFSYVYPFQSYLEIENKKFVIDKIKADFNIIVSQIFEKIAIEITLRSKLPFEIKKIGKWWDNNNEIDVAATGNNEILFGECKWSNKKIGMNIINDLKEKAKKVKWKNDNRKEYFALYSKSGFSEELKDEARQDKSIILFDVNKI